MLSVDSDEQDNTNREMARQKLLKILFPLLYAKTEKLQGGKFLVHIPAKKLIPGGEEVSHIRFEKPGEGEGFMWVGARLVPFCDKRSRGRKQQFQR